jgi:hypothetical protein
MPRGWLRNDQREDFPRGPIRFAISARMQASLKEHILRLPPSAWKPYREDREAVSECADVLNYWPEAEDDKQSGGFCRPSRARSLDYCESVL